MAKHWTEDEVEKLEELVSKGYKYKQIGKELNRTDKAIQSKILKLCIDTHRGLTDKQIKDILSLKDTYTKKDIAKILGISVMTVSKYIRAYNNENNFRDNYNRWTNYEVELLIKLSRKKSLQYIANKLNRSENSVYAKAQKIGIVFRKNKRKWKDEDIEYLKNNWGKVRMNTLKIRLNRDDKSIKQKAYKLGLGGCINELLDNIGNYVPLQEFTKESGISRQRIIETLEPKYNFPLKILKLTKHNFRYYVNLDDTLIWLQNNQSLYDASKISRYLFANEPDWLKSKRLDDISNKSYKKFYRKKWSNTDDEALKLMYYNGKSLIEIAERLDRTPIAVRNRLYKLYKYTK